jgi:hypothetical protein
VAPERYTVTRSSLGSPCVYDTQERRFVLVALRNTDIIETLATLDAMRMLNTCARALNNTRDR